MNENEIKFYSHLGKLATIFSRLEYIIREITGLYIVKNTDEEMVYLSIIGQNNLRQNTSLLKELTYINNFGDEQSSLLKLIGEVNNKRSVRNLFIHGLWDSPIAENGEIFITCNDKSFKLRKELITDEQKLSYSTNITKKINLSTIQKHIIQIEKINIELNLILNKIKENPYQYFE